MAGKRFKVIVCRGPTCGPERHSQTVHAAFAEKLRPAHAAELSWHSCYGQCSNGPNVLVREIVDKEPTFAFATMPSKGRAVLYCQMNPDRVSDVIRSHLENDRVVREYTRPAFPSSDGAETIGAEPINEVVASPLVARPEKE